MTEQDPYRAPDSAGELDPGSIRPMSPLFAAGWTFAAMFAVVLVGIIVLSARPAAADDLVSSIAIQVIGFSAVFFLMLRVHAPRSSISRFVGLRSTSWAFYPLGVVAALAVQLPLTELFNLLITRFPSGAPPSIEPLYLASSPAKRVLIGLGYVAFAPAVEELIFRGGLFVPMLHREGPQRVLLTIVSTGALFAVVHGEWQHVVTVLPLGLAFGYLRWVSGSLGPTLFAHATFNAVAMAQVALHLESAVPPRWLTWVSLAVLAPAVLGIVLLGKRSEAARTAREEDLA